MENEIFLLTDDGYVESLNLDEYASNIDELKKLLIKSEEEAENCIVEDSIIINRGNNCKGYIMFDSVSNQDGTLEHKQYYFFIVKRI
jgi:hypothetical protein